ncbi:leucine-rich repeat domain-containing protein [Sporocytophaga myxococcoides]|uniref:leucine-rich repeat domain-containing protein n=1 Tax=Sporocytophaga myxococcoides TaxID=153721 RepID=UPI000410292A|nr:leucine-rich repeat domain-containing protein [Sporocytophaga myxococcoides]
MKKAGFFLGMILLLSVGKVFSQTVVIPDLNFRKFLVTYYGSVMDANQELIIANAASVTGTFYCGEANIASLEGIQYFKGITALSCIKNNLTTLPDLSNLINLTEIYAYENQITVLPPLNKLVNLKILNVMDNKLSAFPDITGLINLAEIYVYRNQLTSIPDLSGFGNLQTFQCYENKITSIGKMPASLKDLNFGRNLITSFPDISLATGLIYLSCYVNQLSSVPELSAFTSLVQLNLGTNKITSVPNSLSSLTNLTYLTLDNNLLTSLPDLSSLTQLTYFDLKKNYLTFEDFIPSSSNPTFKIWEVGPQNLIEVTSSFKGIQNKAIEIEFPFDQNMNDLTFSWYQNNALRTQTSEPSLVISSLDKSDNGTYYCQVTSSNALLSSLNFTTTSFTITVLPDFISGKELTLTPNGDGKNDEIYFEENGTLKVYDSSGNLVDKMTSPCYWNGLKKSGEELPIGFYVIRINEDITYEINVVK